MLDKITEPTLVIDRGRCLDNISRMAGKAREHSLDFRPHFKTHQSLEVGSWFRDFGVEKIAVSSVSMAEYFIGGGWKDISIAFPFNPRETERINQLHPAARINVTLENTDAIEMAGPILKRDIGAFIKIDTGYGRTGIVHSDVNKIKRVIDGIESNPFVIFRGFIIHAGHTYKCRSKNEVLKVHHDSLIKIDKLRADFLKYHPDLTISYGDTPSCSLADDFSGIDEIRPGNFVYYDLMQNNIGSCSTEQIAVAAAFPVVAKHPERNKIVIHGGAVHLSRESMEINSRTIYGKAVMVDESGILGQIAGIALSSVSQEHGILEVNDEELFRQVNIGDLIYIIPVHSCLTANLLKKTHIINT